MYESQEGETRLKQIAATPQGIHNGYLN